MNDFENFAKDWANENESLQIKIRRFKELLPEIDLHRKGQLIKPVTVPLRTLNGTFAFCKGMLVLFTGYGGAGKSEILRYLGNHYSLQQKTKVAAFVPEATTAVYLDELSTMCEEITSDPDDYVNEHWTILEVSEGMPNIEQLMNEFEDLAIQGHGFFIVDPMNWITTSSYTSMMYESLRLTLTRFKQFAKNTDSVVAYVEHPKTPTPNRDGGYPRANVFMVNGGIMHYNKCDAIVVLHRIKHEDGSVSISDDVDFEVAKMKNQKYLGYPKTVRIKYNWKNFTYQDIEEKKPPWE